MRAKKVRQLGDTKMLFRESYFFDNFPFMDCKSVDEVINKCENRIKYRAQYNIHEKNNENTCVGVYGCLNWYYGNVNKESIRNQITTQYSG